MNSILKAIKICGGQAALAKAAGVSQPAVSQWANGGRIRGEHALAVSKATDWKVTPHELRPDIFAKGWGPEASQPPEQAGTG